MEVRAAEIADGVYRFSTFVPDIAPPLGFTFNQYLITAEEPLLFHTGPKRMFPQISEAVSRILPLEALRWISFGHVESDECGSMNEWLAAAPAATVAHGLTACMVSLNDLADRLPRPLADGEVLDLGGRRVRWLDTPHVPHNWDAGLIYEETTGTLFSSDLFTQVGPAEPTTESDIVAPAIAVSDRLPFMPPTPMTEATMRRLAALKPTTIALMHGPTFKGDGAAALNGLADHYAKSFA